LEAEEQDLKLKVVNNERATGDIEKKSPLIKGLRKKFERKKVKGQSIPNV